jgi:outer membrane cobalamin receptor
MDSIEVLHGAGSTLHGADALSGVVDFLTASPSAASLRLRMGGAALARMKSRCWPLWRVSDGAAV